MIKIRTIAFSLLTAALLAVALAPSAVFATQAASVFTTATRYNLNRQVTGVISPSADGTQGYLAKRYKYDSHGLLQSIEEGVLAAWQDETVDPSKWPSFSVFRQILYTYDDLGRKRTEALAQPNGAVIALTQYSYDDLNQVTCKAVRMNAAVFSALPPDACTPSTESPAGADRITHFEYQDYYGRVTKETRAYGTSDQQVYVTNAYNDLGQLTDVTDANGNLTHLTYDTLNRVQYMYFPSKTTAGQYDSADYEQYGYDNNGNRTTLRKRDGRTISYGYDALNRVRTESYSDGTPAVYYNYDLRNLQLYARFGSDSGSGLTQTYDGFGNLSTASTNQSGSARTLSYLYDAEGHRTRITHPDGAYFVYAYDGLNRLSTITENGSTELARVTYDSAGRPQKLGRGGGVTATTFGYDGISRLQTLTQDLAGTSYDESRTFGYNPASQVISRYMSNGVYVFNQAVAGTVNYAANGLNEYTSLTTTASVTPGYDTNGNMTFDGSTTYGYDILNRMTSASGGHTVKLAYDPKGRLYQTSGGASGTTEYLYDGDALVAEYNGSGTLLRRYVHGVGADVPLVWYEGASVGSANRKYYHVDNQGSVDAVADSGGNATLVNTYDAYGVPASGNSGRFQYTGQAMLPDLGLYYYKARIYNPQLGRFMQVDPVGYKADLDLYAYVGDDPLDGVDPTGEVGCLGDAITCADHGKVEARDAAKQAELQKKMTEVRQKGAQGEQEAGIDPKGPKGRIQSRTGTAKFRVPDGQDAEQITEVKNVGKFRVTNQIKDFVAEAIDSARKLVIKIRNNTKISESAQRYIDENNIRMERSLGGDPSPNSSISLEPGPLEAAEPTIIEIP